MGWWPMARKKAEMGSTSTCSVWRFRIRTPVTSFLLTSRTSSTTVW